MNKELLMERITALCKEKGINLTTAFEQSGVGKNFRSNLKTSNPSDKNLYLLAKYFNVSIEYLLSEETEEDLARKALGLVLEWLDDNGFEVQQDERDDYSIGKDGHYIYLSSADFTAESLRIKAVAEQGFELAMEKWEQKRFPSVHIDRCNNHLFNAINESPNATLNINGTEGFTAQELELIDLYRNFPLRKQMELLNYAFNLKEGKQ